MYVKRKEKRHNCSNKMSCQSNSRVGLLASYSWDTLVVRNFWTTSLWALRPWRVISSWEIHLSMEWTRRRVEIELPFGLGPRTKLGILSHLYTCIGLHTRLWVRSLGMAYEGVSHLRLPGSWAGLHYVLLDHI